MLKWSPIDRRMVDGWALIGGRLIHYAIDGKTLCGRRVHWSEVFTNPEVYGPVTCTRCARRLPVEARADEHITAHQSLPLWRRLFYWVFWAPRVKA